MVNNPIELHPGIKFKFKGFLYQSAGKKLIWPLPQAILFTECCLIGGDFAKINQFVDFPSGSSSNLLESFSVEVTLRSKLVKCWYSLRNGDLDCSLILEGKQTS